MPPGMMPYGMPGMPPMPGMAPPGMPPHMQGMPPFGMPPPGYGVPAPGQVRRRAPAFDAFLSSARRVWSSLLLTRR